MVQVFSLSSALQPLSFPIPIGTMLGHWLKNLHPRPLNSLRTNLSTSEGHESHEGNVAHRGREMKNLGLGDTHKHIGKEKETFSTTNKRRPLFKVLCRVPSTLRGFGY